MFQDRHLTYCRCALLRRYDRASYAQKCIYPCIRGSSKAPLGAGLWRYSRHPNYFFEQLFWWSLAVFGATAGHPWVFVGPLFNTLCMVQVTVLTEQRMLRRPERVALYKSYMRRTSAWVPMPAVREKE